MQNNKCGEKFAEEVLQEISQAAIQTYKSLKEYPIASKVYYA